MCVSARERETEREREGERVKSIPAQMTLDGIKKCRISAARPL